ncbi:hypothetical protein [Abyssalbus ytuae]|uniref:Uncharacterized protein n=1 Tax=Abyssalbus ytuae TaxID=2926907 RepID=A0A9E7D2S4_9FLAO|nr:hypothetical protein [Abyssalbus ytuae]UOB18473.1 hypothetical protein MQE35_04075 [Abyssalbus ytuae]
MNTPHQTKTVEVNSSLLDAFKTNPHTRKTYVPVQVDSYGDLLCKVQSLIDVSRGCLLGMNENIVSEACLTNIFNLLGMARDLLNIENEAELLDELYKKVKDCP